MSPWLRSHGIIDNWKFICKRHNFFFNFRVLYKICRRKWKTLGSYLPMFITWLIYCISTVSILIIYSVLGCLNVCFVRWKRWPSISRVNVSIHNRKTREKSLSIQTLPFCEVLSCLGSWPEHILYTYRLNICIHNIDEIILPLFILLLRIQRLSFVSKYQNGLISKYNRWWKISKYNQYQKRKTIEITVLVSMPFHAKSYCFN